jgi:hypothetical protein
VLAHVEGTRQLPASVHSAEYIAWARSKLGDPARRTLAEDAHLLAGGFPSHDALAQAHALARSFSSLERLLAVGARPLAELGPADVDDPAALARSQHLGAAGELLFCAMTLELVYFLQLPAPPPAPVELLEALLELEPLAPGLSRARVGCVRSLHLRATHAQPQNGEELPERQPGVLLSDKETVGQLVRGQVVGFEAEELMHIGECPLVEL